MKKILIIDDEEDLCRVLKLMLESEGMFEVFTATDAETGMFLALSKEPELILLDVVMPWMSGTKMAEELLKIPQTRSIPIIFISALVDKSFLKDSIKDADNMEFMPKPLNIEELVAKIMAMTG
jgi:DNA-binding response OmpR family regulator